MLEMEINSWTDAILNFFEVEVKKSDLYKVREKYFKKLQESKAEKDEAKKSKKQQAEDNALDELLKVRRNGISENIKSFIFDWVVKGKAPYVVPDDIKLITKVTHPLKYAHSADLNTGVCEQNIDLPNFVSTASIRDKSYDLAHHNGAIVNLVRLLGVTYHRKMIFDHVLQDDFNFLEGFKLTKQENEEWQQRFKSWVTVKELNTTGRAKQIYFPTDEVSGEQKYDLLIPLHSSTLSYEMYKRVYANRFTEVKKEIGTAKNGNLYHALPSAIFPKIAALEYGNGQPQNISLLNVKMNGIGYLLPASPPEFQIQNTPIMNKKSVFGQGGFSGYFVKQPLSFMSDFLVRFSRLNLSIKDPKKIIWLHNWCDQIVEQFFSYVISQQEFEQGWSMNDKCKLVDEYQLLLDPFRQDEVFQKQFDNGGWQKKIIDDFAFWLNRELEAKNENFTSNESHLSIWKARLKPKLREHFEELKQLRKVAGFKI
jgi:CRISPR-associated protein Csy1